MKTTRGMTLLEAVVSIALFSIISVVVVTSILFFYRANTSSLEQSYQINNARKGVELMIRDLREASAGDDGSYPILVMADNSITFFSDTDLDQGVERISYTLTNTTLERTVLDSSGNPPTYTGVGVTTPVSEYVRNIEESQSIFHYYDQDGVEIVDYNAVGDVRFISVSLVVNVLPIRAPAEFTLRSSATLRNIRND